MRHEQPPDQTLFQRVVAIAHRRLRNLNVESLHVAQQLGSQRLAPIERLPQRLRTDAQGCAFQLGPEGPSARNCTVAYCTQCRGSPSMAKGPVSREAAFPS